MLIDFDRRRWIRFSRIVLFGERVHQQVVPQTGERGVQLAVDGDGSGRHEQLALVGNRADPGLERLGPGPEVPEEQCAVPQEGPKPGEGLVGDVEGARRPGDRLLDVGPCNVCQRAAMSFNCSTAS